MASVRQLAGSPLAAGAWSGLLGAALWFVPGSFDAAVRGSLGDTLKPGLSTVAAVHQWWSTRHTSSADDREAVLRQQLRDMQAAYAAGQERTRQLAARLAEATLANEQQRQPASDDSSARLMTPALIDAVVLGPTLSKEWRSGMWIDRGQRHTVKETALVLASRKPLIDVGRPEQLAPEDTLLVGRTVIGKIDAVGRWSSTYLPVTDPDFRGRAQIVRVNDQGASWGAEGLLRGTGVGCRLDGVSADEPVNVGDFVYTNLKESLLAIPLVYGEITSVQPTPDGREWRIEVRPGLAESSTTHVQVLRAGLNPSRLWTH